MLNSGKDTIGPGDDDGNLLWVIIAKRSGEYRAIILSLFTEIGFQDLLKSGKKYLNIGTNENEIKNTKSTKKSSKKKKIRKKKRDKKIGNEHLKNSKEKIRNLKNKTNKKVPENKLERKKNQRTKHTESKANKSKGKFSKSKKKKQKKKKKVKKVKKKKIKLKEKLKDDENTEGVTENDPSIENPIRYNNSGTSSHDNTDNDDQRTEIIGPHDDSSDDKVEPKHYLDYTEPSEEDIMSILNQVLAAEHKARNVKETTSEATLPIRAPEKNRKKRKKKKQKKKKKKKQTKKPKCNWYKNKSREVRKNFDGFKVRNCGRARMRGNLSYDTMWSVYRQLFGLTKHANTAARQIAEYEQFLETVTEFLSQYPVCETNLQWNHVMIEVTLTNDPLDLTTDICR